MIKLVLAMLWIILTTSLNQAQSYDRNILLEVFTNSHCPLCPIAHNTIYGYLLDGQYNSQVRYIYYHMPFPYADDQLNQASNADATARNNYYGPYSGTPVTFFDGSNKGNSYMQWGSYIDSRVGEKTPVELTLNGEMNDINFMLNAEINMETSLVNGDLVIHFVAVEDVRYVGRNGIVDHTNVMRKMLGSSNGQSLSIAANQTSSISGSLDAVWDPANTGFVVFVQNVDTKEVLQSEYISYTALAVTGIENESSIPIDFDLKQNYPNPFNPSTKISYTIPQVETGSATSLQAKLIVYNLLGKEIKTLVNQQQDAGNYSVEFNASSLPSGIYFYRLSYGAKSITKKMTVLK